MAEPEYPRITDVHEQPTTTDVILASDPEVRFDGQPQRRAICTLYGADGSIAVAISDLPEDLEHGPRTLAEQLAESMMTGGRITLTGPLCSSRMYPTIAVGWANSLSGAGCCSSTDSSTPRNIRPRRRPPSSSASTTPGAGRLTAERSHPTTAASPIYVGANRTARCLPIYRGTITPTSAWHQDTGCCAPCPWRALALGHVELQGVQPADDLLRSQPRRTHRADEVTLAECRRRDL